MSDFTRKNFTTWFLGSENLLTLVESLPESREKFHSFELGISAGRDYRLSFCITRAILGLIFAILFGKIRVWRTFSEKKSKKFKKKSKTPGFYSLNFMFTTFMYK